MASKRRVATGHFRQGGQKAKERRTKSVFSGIPTGQLRQGEPMASENFAEEKNSQDQNPPSRFSSWLSLVFLPKLDCYKVGAPSSVSVTHLQFADDTLILGVKSWANVRAMRAVLVLFEAMSRLKVNFNKSMLVGVNVSDSWLNEAASILRCRVGKVLFVYLGLSIGGDPRRLIFWEPLLRSIKTRLSGFNSRFLSFGGRLVLLKSILTSLPVYALSFFKASLGIISSLDSIFTFFFCGGCEDHRKLSWVSWTTICSRREVGGLGVQRLREFNVELLAGKWCWRLLVERSSLWYRVLVARYGEEDERLEVGGRSDFSWCVSHMRAILTLIMASGQILESSLRKEKCRKVVYIVSVTSIADMVGKPGANQ
ncbi:hypothetical protein MTR_0061s0090 [Medicago truncatula]|uniref:RNA-directed DNA polymerase n=1 Tax=Medicago truncatula TaxID=3880 RepID=A0A072THS0_MEDTR|nr:hypothetical protein MTR_0061s0090 [Medicago truncatula]